MLHVYEGRNPAPLLRLGNDMLAQRGLARRLRPVDLGHPAPRDATYPQGNIQRQSTCGDGLHVKMGALTQFHNRPVAKPLTQTDQGRFQGFSSTRIVHDYRSSVYS
jgi:hypothetical protein